MSLDWVNCQFRLSKLAQTIILSLGLLYLFHGFTLPFFGFSLIFFGMRKCFFSPKGGSEVEVKKLPPPLKTLINTKVSKDLVEVEVKLLYFFES